MINGWCNATFDANILFLPENTGHLSTTYTLLTQHLEAKNFFSKKKNQVNLIMEKEKKLLEILEDCLF